MRSCDDDPGILAGRGFSSAPPVKRRWWWCTITDSQSGEKYELTETRHLGSGVDPIRGQRPAHKRITVVKAWLKASAPDTQQQPLVGMRGHPRPFRRLREKDINSGEDADHHIRVETRRGCQSCCTCGQRRMPKELRRRGSWTEGAAIN